MNKILIIDDDQITSTILSNQLKKAGYEVKIINDPTDVDINSLQERYELVLLDVIMPKISGLDLLQDIRLQSNQNELPVIMLTALNETKDIVTALTMGANDYITKPANLEVAVSRIKTHLNLVKLRKKSERSLQLEAINAMVATYNHEINNPLAIAMGSLGLLKKTNPENIQIERLEKSLNRIKDIVKKIQDVEAQQQLDFQTYSERSKMVKIK